MRRMYSLAQIQAIVALMASKGELDFSNVDLKVKTLDATGEITGSNILETMSGYSFAKTTKENLTLNYIYAGVVKTGNKITFVINLEATRTGSVTNDNFNLGQFIIPSSIGAKLFPSITIGLNNVLSIQNIYCANSYYQGKSAPVVVYKNSQTAIAMTIYSVNTLLDLDTTYNVRIEQTFLLSENLASE